MEQPSFSGPLPIIVHHPEKGCSVFLQAAMNMAMLLMMVTEKEMQVRRQVK